MAQKRAPKKRQETGQKMVGPTADAAQGAAVYAEDRAHVFHSWSAQAQITPIPVAGALGSYFWDYDGKSYLDFSSQLVFTNIGHQHPKVVAAIQEQAGLLATIAPQHANSARNGAASRIVEIAGEKFEKVFFTNAGADAIENAIRMARIHTGKHKILSTYRSYHGNTGSAINATGDPRRFPNEFSSGHAHNHIEKLLPVLTKSLSNLGMLPARTPGTPKEFSQLIEAYGNISMDGLESACVRPQDKDLQETRYSGKKNATP